MGKLSRCILGFKRCSSAVGFIYERGSINKLLCNDAEIETTKTFTEICIKPDFKWRELT